MKYDEIHYWSEIKLDIVRDYAAAYSKILNAQKNPALYHIYIDAFAGTGYRKLRIEDKQGFDLTDLAGEDAKAFHDGSAKIALRTNPRFREYYFIEQDPIKCTELEKLKEEFPEKAT